MRPIAACAMRVVERTRVSQVTPESPVILRAMVLTASFALSPATGLSCNRHQWNCFHRLDTSVGVSGPHDFSVRIPRRSSKALSASTASRPAFVTIANAPLEGRDGGDLKVIWVRRQVKNSEIQKSGAPPVPDGFTRNRRDDRKSLMAQRLRAIAGVSRDGVIPDFSANARP